MPSWYIPLFVLRFHNSGLHEQSDLSSNPDSTTKELNDLGQVTSVKFNFLICKMGHNDSVHP